MKNIHSRAARSLIVELHAAGWSAESTRSWCVRQGFEVTLEDVQDVIDDIGRRDNAPHEPDCPDQNEGGPV